MNLSQQVVILVNGNESAGFKYVRGITLDHLSRDTAKDLKTLVFLELMLHFTNEGAEVRVGYKQDSLKTLKHEKDGVLCTDSKHLFVARLNQKPRFFHNTEVCYIPVDATTSIRVPVNEELLIQAISYLDKNEGELDTRQARKLKQKLKMRLIDMSL